MGGLQLLPGEREELGLRPAATGFLASYLAALLPAAAGGLLWLWTQSESWKAGARPETVPLPERFYGTEFALAFYVVAAVAAFALAVRLLRRTWTGLWLALLLLGLMAAGRLALDALGVRQSIPLLVGLLAIPALAFVEARRLTARYHLTNLRLVHRRTVGRLERSVRYQDMVDLHARAGPGDVGTLVPIVTSKAGGPGAAPVRFPGIRPFGRVKALVELLVQSATAGPYLRAEGRIQERTAEARAALHRR